MLSTETLIQTKSSALWIVENYTDDYYDILKDVFTYEKPPIKIMGRDCHQQRNVSFYSDESQGYKYSGQTMKSLALSNVELFPLLLDSINESLNTNFNGILVNRYIDGSNYLSAHGDDEDGLDKNNKIVAGLSYGPGVRKFRIRDKKSKEIILDYEQKPCTLLVMQGEFQKEFTHEIPKQLKIKEERISITLRSHTK